jgi:hypothetical protein
VFGLYSPRVIIEWICNEYSCLDFKQCLCCEISCATSLLSRKPQYGETSVSLNERSDVCLRQMRICIVHYTELDQFHKVNHWRVCTVRSSEDGKRQEQVSYMISSFRIGEQRKT